MCVITYFTKEIENGLHGLLETQVQVGENLKVLPRGKINAFITVPKISCCLVIQDI